MHVLHSEIRNAIVGPTSPSHSFLVIFSTHFEALKLPYYIKNLRKAAFVIIQGTSG